MTYRIFGAIDVGSYEVNLKIYELSMKNGIRLLNHVRHRLDLGSDTYATGKIGTELVDELCQVLLEADHEGLWSTGVSCLCDLCDS